MLDITPQERLALIVLSVLIAGGAVARHLEARQDATDWLTYSSERADTLNPNESTVLRAEAEAALAEEVARAEPLREGERLDPNRASAVDLDRLPRVGPALADRIVAHRATVGRFRSLEDLDQVSGIGPALLEAISPHVDLPPAPLARPSPTAARTTSQATPEKVDINSADTSELQALPGIGPALAERVVAHRAEHGRFQTWDELENVPGIGPRLRERLEGIARLGN